MPSGHWVNLSINEGWYTPLYIFVFASTIFLII